MQRIKVMVEVCQDKECLFCRNIVVKHAFAYKDIIQETHMTFENACVIYHGTVKNNTVEMEIT